MTEPEQNSFDLDALLEDAGAADDARLRGAVESLHAAGSLPAPRPTGALADLLDGRKTAAEAASAAGIATDADAEADNVLGFDPAKPRKRRGGGAVTGGMTVVALAAAAGLAGVAAADVAPRAAAPVVSVTVPPGELEHEPERPNIDATKAPEPEPERVVKRTPAPTPTPEPVQQPAPAPEQVPVQEPVKKPDKQEKVLNPGQPASTMPKTVKMGSKSNGRGKKHGRTPGR
ncbi:hypothetical protein [Zhihengliuella salsuginis]|uniref:Uncharacterized protein n=1 Tax=Zhihengliuella salsuginis TaxID=578222 RepID=A0ABQ3GBB3_9MICC|nr:hypothetical protein [Zhihengliuella salsuginis]GHC99381.1 hypothetical protein GCM10008096_01460 [Zhihengliuella salsuginis]